MGRGQQFLRSVRALVGGPRVYGLHHTGLTVSNFEAAVSWWSTHFGFRLVAEQTISGTQAEQLAGLYGACGLTVRLGFLRASGGNVLEIFTFNPAISSERTDWRRPGYTHIALAVRDVGAMHRRLTAAGVCFETEVNFTSGAHWAFFRDPDDNLVEIIDLHANRLPLKYAGGLVGSAFKRGKWANYYR